MKKPTCTVMVGLPGLGKSTYLKFLDDPEFGDTVFVYSTDKYIEEQAAALGKTYNEVFSDYVGKAHTRMDALLEIAIKERVDVYWDQTNITVGKRKKIINRMRQAGYNVKCVCFCPPETKNDVMDWAERLKSRPGKTIPAHVMQSMWKNFQKPIADEGFDSIVYYDMNGAKIDVS